MLALVASSGSAENVELREIPVPSPDPNQAVVAVKAVSLNRGEVNRLRSAEDGAVFGWDLAGVVTERAGDGSGPPAGTRVVGFVTGGSWAEQVAAAVNRLAPLPDDVSFAAAATLPVAGLTALRTLRLGGLLLGTRVLVTGASGGVGRYSVQLASLSGARVTGVAGSAERAQGLRELGAAEVVTDIGEAHGPFHLILESVGGPSLAAALGLVDRGGTIVTFGNSSGQETTVNIGVFYGRSGARMEAFSLLAPNQPPNFDEDLAYLAGLMAEGRLQPEIDYEGSWRKAPEALAALRERRVRGKAVLLVD
jgi:NADPH:quinone reductase-like Zn-dependent oxidoreductase